MGHVLGMNPLAGMNPRLRRVAIVLCIIAAICAAVIADAACGGSSSAAPAAGATSSVGAAAPHSPAPPSHSAGPVAHSAVPVSPDAASGAIKPCGFFTDSELAQIIGPGPYVTQAGGGGCNIFTKTAGMTGPLVSVGYDPPAPGNQQVFDAIAAQAQPVNGRSDVVAAAGTINVLMAGGGLLDVEAAGGANFGAMQRLVLSKLG